MREVIGFPFSSLLTHALAVLLIGVSGEVDVLFIFNSSYNRYFVQTVKEGEGSFFKPQRLESR